ncbi:MMPL family transporter [Sporichthya polymorpha]|uniref:MMPL family transporter n=1 Tax=Sporichthya polymorpha TaxID=35751 RepID=UPI00035DF051|nr:MMPL family transporter [Sporichthya polymorpha]
MTTTSFSNTQVPGPRHRRPDRDGRAAGASGPVGRLGGWAADHARLVFTAWLLITVGLGMFAPKVEHALSGAGWQANGSESVQVRELVGAQFGGLNSTGLMVVLHSAEQTVDSPEFARAVAAVSTELAADDRVAAVVPPTPGTTISADRHTAIVMAGAVADANEMVRAADDLKGPITALGTAQVQIALTGASGMWSDFNEANRDAMMKSELMSWPVTLGILVLAFGSLVAAGLPLLLTILGLVASAGSLFLLTELTPISIWAMNFALMFALALGIDYALFVVYRFRGALFGSRKHVHRAVEETMDTAGKAVLFSGVTVLISLSAVMLVDSPAFRSMAVGIMLSVVFVLAATLTLLPAILGRLGARVDRLALPWAHSGEHRSARFAAWGERLWRRPWAAGIAAVIGLGALAVPVLSLDTGMPSIAVVPEDDSSRQGYVLVQQAFGPGAPGALQIVGPAVAVEAAAATVARDPGIAAVMPVQPGGGGQALVQAVPASDPSDPATGDTIDRLREALPESVLVGGAVAENHDLESELAAKTPLVIGVVLALGFLLLLVALQAPLVALIGTVTNLLATGAAFGVAKLIFQDGHGADLLGFESQGFLDAWGPVFFFAMIFAIAMDYTVFLLSSAKEHWDRGEGAKGAMVGGLAHSGRVIFAAAAVMVAVFFTFALSGPLPPKEMGIILGIAVLLDALLVRLLLVPILLRLTGTAAWWTPRWLARILPDVRFGH